MDSRQISSELNKNNIATEEEHGYNIDSDIRLDIEDERARQLKLWGVQSHPPEIWMIIAQEEFGEVAQAIQKSHFSWSKETDKGEMYEELIQTIAVLIAFAEDVKKRDGSV